MNEETLFREALSRSPAERAAFLEQACAGRPKLLATVESLLASHAEHATILDKPGAEHRQGVDAAPCEAQGSATREFTPERANLPPPLAGNTDYRPNVEPGVIGLSYGSAGRTGDAVRMHEQVAAAFQKKFGPAHPDTQIVIGYLAAAYKQDHRLDAAETAYRDLITATRPSLPADSPDLARTLGALGEILLAARKFPEAEGALREGLGIREKKMPDHYRTFDTKSKLGGALLGQKKYTDAEPLLLEGDEGMKQQEAKIPPKDRVRLPEAVERLMQLYEALGKKEEVAKWRKELEAIKTSPAKPEKMP
jgi:hypothetical protein